MGPGVDPHPNAAGESDVERPPEAYLAQLAEPDGYVRGQANRLPLDRRVLVTAHDAFIYFGKACGFELRALFVESTVPVRNIEALNR